MNAANQRRLTPLLVALAGLLGAAFLVLLAGVGRSVHWSPPRALAPLPPAGNPADQPMPQPLQQFALVWQKPVFSPDRKPMAHVADGGSNLGDLALTGVIITPNLRMVLLHDRHGDHELRLREGESLPDGSVTLVEIHARSALFDAPSGRTELKLPAGAPIDAPKAGPAADAGGQGTPGAAEMRVQSQGQPAQSSPRPISDDARPGPPQQTIRASRQPTADQLPGARLEQLRQNIEKRRAAAAANAATH